MFDLASIVEDGSGELFGSYEGPTPYNFWGLGPSMAQKHVGCEWVCSWGVARDSFHALFSLM